MLFGIKKETAARNGLRCFMLFIWGPGLWTIVWWWDRGIDGKMLHNNSKQIGNIDQTVY